MIRFMKRNILLSCGLVMFALLLFVALFGEYFPFVDDRADDAYNLVDGVIMSPPYEPSSQYWLGSDRDGRDMLSLIILGTKETLLFVVLITMIRYLVAIPLSYLAHKKVLGSHFIVNCLNSFFSYVPTIMIVVMIAILPPLLFTESRPYWLIFIIAMVEVGRVADTLKGDFDALASKEFMLSAKAIGATNFRILRTYYLPFVYGKIIVYVISDLGKVMFLLGQLGFLSIFTVQEFIQTDIASFEIRNHSMSWPMLLEEAFMDIRGPIWISFWPVFAMTVTIFTFHMIAQGLQQLFKRKGAML